MDPISIATAAATAAQALFVIAEFCLTFRNATRNVDRSVQALEGLSRGLAGVLNSLEKALQDPIFKNPRNADRCVSVRDEVQSCKAFISVLEKKLAPLREVHTSLAQQALRTARLRLKQPEIVEVLSGLQMHSMNLQLALQTIEVTIALSIPGALSASHAIRFDRLERMIEALSPSIDPTDSRTRIEATSDALLNIFVDENTKQLYWSASSIVSESGSTHRSVTDVPVKNLRREEPAFEDFSTILSENPGVTGSETGEPPNDERHVQIQNWSEIVEAGNASETVVSDDESDDELDSDVAASLFERGMKCYSREEFDEAREWLQRGIARAGPLSPETQDELKVPSMQFHHALCCIVGSVLDEAESSFLLVIKGKGSGSREEDSRLNCFAHYHLARIHLKKDKLELALYHCKKAVGRMKREKTIGRASEDYYKSLRLLALILWANGSKYDAQAHSDQLPLSQQIPADQFEKELSLVIQSHRSEITLRDETTENAGGLSIVSDSSTGRDTLVASPVSSRSYMSPRPISIDSTENEMKTATSDMVSIVETDISASKSDTSRSDTSTFIIDNSNAATQVIERKGYDKKNGVNKGMQWAVKEGRLDVLNILLKNPWADVDMRKSNIIRADKTLLQTAASRGLYSICERLLKARATVNLMIDGQTALDCAIENNYEDVCRLLLENGANFDCMREQKMTPLTRAMQHDRFPICQLLIDHGADIDERDFKVTKKRRTALMQAAAHNKAKSLRWLLDHGAKVDGPEPDISTPLIEAARANAINACRILLEHDANRYLGKAKGTAIDVTFGWLKEFIREWPASRSWNLPEGLNGSYIMMDPLGVNRQI